MHILCDTCSGLFQRYRLTVEAPSPYESHWKLKIPRADQVPAHI